MRQEDFVKGMAFLGEAYGRKFTKETVTVWWEFFRDESDEDFRKAIIRLGSLSEKMPSIAELKKEIAWINLPQLNADDEWLSVRRAIRRFGSYDIANAEKSLDPFTLHVVKLMGGFSVICRAKDDDWLRRNFTSLWNEQREKQIKARAIGKMALTAEERNILAAIKQREALPLLESAT